MPNKIPPYFEKYFEQKFADIAAQISDLKLHVNDELADLKRIAKTNQNNILKLWIVVILLVAYHVFMEDGSKLWDLLKAFL